MTRISALALLAVGLAACSAAPAEPAGDRVPAIRLTATLSTPTDVTLSWLRQDSVTVAWQAVEFATEPGGPYTILQFLGPDQTAYTHPDLMPETPFYYRVRPVHGPASDPVDVTLPAGDFDAEAREDDHEWAVPRTVARGPVTTRPIRDARTAAAAAPTDLTATVMHANGIRFTWTDHATDEEGYLIEVRAAGSPRYATAALLDPDVNSFGLVTLPNEKTASFRVRAFYFGAPSNVAHQRTGPAGQ
ncbi:MAG TPA: fibronectin type III domain-containing protein [Pilimelia sp.]|nr:fibronectin type III domain-containing protein [Pilimelia sp.]